MMFLQNLIPFIFVEVFTFAIKVVPTISPKSIDVITILIVGKLGQFFVLIMSLLVDYSIVDGLVHIVDSIITCHVDESIMSTSQPSAIDVVPFTCDNSCCGYWIIIFPPFSIGKSIVHYNHVYSFGGFTIRHVP